MNEHDDPSGSVTLRRSREGVFWTLIVPADGKDLDSMRAAVEVARAIDAELRDAYPRRSPKPKTTDTATKEPSAS
jgi:hypothetical protein